MKKKKEEHALNNSNKQRFPGDIANLQIKVRQLEEAVTMIEEEAFECMRFAKRKSGLNYVIKGNNLKSNRKILLPY